jgi:hypothetical protein
VGNIQTAIQCSLQTITIIQFNYQQKQENINKYMYYNIILLPSGHQKHGFQLWS